MVAVGWPTVGYIVKRLLCVFRGITMGMQLTLIWAVRHNYGFLMQHLGINLQGLEMLKIHNSIGIAIK